MGLVRSLFALDEGESIGDMLVGVGIMLYGLVILGLIGGGGYLFYQAFHDYNGSLLANTPALLGIGLWIGALLLVLIGGLVGLYRHAQRQDEQLAEQSALLKQMSKRSLLR